MFLYKYLAHWLKLSFFKGLYFFVIFNNLNDNTTFNQELFTRLLNVIYE